MYKTLGIVLAFGKHIVTSERMGYYIIRHETGTWSVYILLCKHEGIVEEFLSKE